MFRFDSNLRKKVLSLYTLKDVCLNNKASFTIVTNGYYFCLITASVFCVIEYGIIVCQGTRERKQNERYKLMKYFLTRDFLRPCVREGLDAPWAKIHVYFCNKPLKQPITYTVQFNFYYIISLLLKYFYQCMI